MSVQWGMDKLYAELAKCCVSVQWGSREWDKLYAELPSRQLKVKVRDRSVVETRDFERVCVAPVGLQQEIDQLVQGTPKGRAFVR